MNSNFKDRAISQSLSSATTEVWLVSTHVCLVFVIALAYCVLFLPAAGAQLYTGSISGTISDSSGAFIAGTQVQATDDAKGFSFTATSDAGGRYVIRPLPPANYTVSVTAKGFKTQRKTGITIAVNQNASVDFSLTVGAFAEVVDVRAGAVELQTEDAETGQVVNRRFINDLPLIDATSNR